MKRIILAVLGLLTVSAGADAQNTAQMIERALAAAPARARDGASVVRWNADFTYETIKEGTNQMVCYDRSGDPGEAAFAVQCTVLGSFERVSGERQGWRCLDHGGRHVGRPSHDAGALRGVSQPAASV